MDILPIRKVIRNQRVLELLASQFLPAVELGVEFVESRGNERFSIEVYRLYTRKSGEEFDRDRFIVERHRRHGKIRAYSIEGDIFVNQ